MVPDPQETLASCRGPRPWKSHEITLYGQKDEAEGCSDPFFQHGFRFTFVWGQDRCSP